MLKRKLWFIGFICRSAINYSSTSAVATTAQNVSDETDDASRIYCGYWVTRATCEAQNYCKWVGTCVQRP